MTTQKDLEAAWSIIEMCWRDESQSFRLAIANEIALLIAKVRKLEGKK